MAKQITDLQKIRRKKKRNHLIKRLIAIIVLAVIAFCGFVTKDKWLPVFDGIFYRFQTAISKDDKSNNFPIKIGTSTKFDITSFQDKLVLLTDTKFTMFNRNGKVTQSNQHEMAKPVMKSMNERVLIYDSGGNNILMESRSKEIYSKKLTDKILYAQLSSKGYLAVVTSSDVQATLLTIYNPNGDKIFYSTLNEKVIDVLFDKDSKGCVATTISSKGGQLLSKQYAFKFDKEKEEWKGSPIVTLALKTAYNSDNNIALIGDTQYNVISGKGEVKYTYTINDSLIGCDTSGDLSAIITQNPQKRITNLIIIDKNNQPKVVNIDDEYKNVYIDNNKVYLLTKKSLQIYSSNGNLLAKKDFDVYYSDIAIIDKQIFLLSSQAIDRIDSPTK